MGNVAGIPRPFGSLGTITGSDIVTNTEWTIEDYSLKLGDDVALEKGSAGNIAQFGVSGEYREATFTVIAEAATVLTAANALLAMVLPKKGTVMTVAGATLPAALIGTWNMWECSFSGKIGEFSKIQCTMRQFAGTGGTYAALPIVT